MSTTSSGKPGQSSDSDAKNSRSSMVRTTIVIPQALHRNLEVLRLTNRVSKNDLIREALQEYVSMQGLSPDKNPTVKISY